MQVVNVHQKLSLFNEHWTPKIIGELNGQQVKLAKLQGEFVWHSHADEDELFLVIKGILNIEFRDRLVQIAPGELLIVPRGVEHRPFCTEECHVMLFEPAATRHTGEVVHELTKTNLERI